MENCLILKEIDEIMWRNIGIKQQSVIRDTKEFKEEYLSVVNTDNEPSYCNIMKTKYVLKQTFTVPGYDWVWYSPIGPNNANYVGSKHG